MKIALATPLFPPDLGGPATYSKLLVDYLPKEGDEVVLIKFSDVRELPKVIRHIAYFFRVLRMADKCDVILALDPVSVGFPALIAASILNKPFVVKVVGDFAWEQGTQRFDITDSLDAFVRKGQVPLPVAFLRMIQTFVARSAKQVIVPSLYLKGILTQWGIDPKKISVIYNSIESPIATDVSAKSPHLLVSVGRLVPWKGMSELIDALVEVRKSISDATLMLVGDGPDRSLLESKAKKVFGDEAEQIVSFTGARSHEDTLRAMQSAGVFVLNSTYEGLSHTVIEALMLGSAIVVSDAGGNPELVEEAVNGLVVRVGNTSSLTAAILKLLRDPELSAHVSRNAKSSATKFEVTTMIAKTRTLLSLAISKTNP